MNRTELRWLNGVEPERPPLLLLLAPAECPGARPGGEKSSEEHCWRVVFLHLGASACRM